MTVKVSGRGVNRREFVAWSGMAAAASLAGPSRAWGAVTQVKTFAPLPKSFDGPNLELTLRFNVGQGAAQNLP